MDVNMIFKGEEGYTPMHICGIHGSLNVLLGLISRGAGVDPPDINCKTPLVLAIENNKSAVIRSLIELGADIESKDNF